MCYYDFLVEEILRMNKNAQTVPMTMKKAYNRVGLSMLVFYGVFSAASVIALAAALAIAFIAKGGPSGGWLRELIRRGGSLLNDAAFTDAVLYGSVAGSLIGMPIGILVMKTVLPKFSKAPERRDLSFGQMLMIIVMAYGLWGVGALLGNLPSFFGVEMISDFTEGASTPALLVYTFYAIIGAPILEELVCRKTLLDRVHGYGQVTAAFVTALLFGLIHGNPAQFPLAFMLGLLLATVYMKTGRIVYTMLLHFLINFTATLPELVYYIFGADISMGWNIVVPVMIAAGIVFIIVFRKHDLLKLKRTTNPRANQDTFKNVGMLLAIIGGGIMVVSSVGLSFLEDVLRSDASSLWILVPVGVSVGTIISVPLTIGKRYTPSPYYTPEQPEMVSPAPKPPVYGPATQQTYGPVTRQPYGYPQPPYGQAPQQGYGYPPRPYGPMTQPPYGQAPQQPYGYPPQSYGPMTHQPYGPMPPRPYGPAPQPAAETDASYPKAGAPEPPNPLANLKPAPPEVSEAPAEKPLDEQIEQDYLRSRESVPEEAKENDRSDDL